MASPIRRQLDGSFTTQMKRHYTMFVDWKNQYCQKDYTTQGNLQIQIQCNPSQITNGIFHVTRTKKKILKCVWKHRRPQTVKASMKKKNGASSMRLPDVRLYTTELQS